MRTAHILLTAALSWANASAVELRCAADADCAALGARYQCVERVCRKKPGGPVKEEDRACRKDSDCAVVLLECRCMYCARPEDFQAGVVAAVSKKRLKAYEALGKCSPEQQHQCAMAGACAMTGTSEARCRAKSCFVEYAPRMEK